MKFQQYDIFLWTAFFRSLVLVILTVVKAAANTYFMFVMNRERSSHISHGTSKVQGNIETNHLLIGGVQPPVDCNFILEYLDIYFG